MLTFRQFCETLGMNTGANLGYTGGTYNPYEIDSAFQPDNALIETILKNVLPKAGAGLFLTFRRPVREALAFRAFQIAADHCAKSKVEPMLHDGGEFNRPCVAIMCRLLNVGMNEIQEALEQVRVACRNHYQKMASKAA